MGITQNKCWRHFKVFRMFWCEVQRVSTTYTCPSLCVRCCQTILDFRATFAGKLVPLQPKLALQAPGAAQRCCPRVLPAPFPAGMDFQSTLQPGSANPHEMALFRGDFFPRQCRNAVKVAELSQREEPSSPSACSGQPARRFSYKYFQHFFEATYFRGGFQPLSSFPLCPPSPLFFPHGGHLMVSGEIPPRA